VQQQEQLEDQMAKHPRGEMPVHQNTAMTQGMKDDLVEQAHRYRMSPSEFIRRLLDAALYGVPFDAEFRDVVPTGPGKPTITFQPPAAS
jgi:hypothetical protein